MNRGFGWPTLLWPLRLIPLNYRTYQSHCNNLRGNDRKSSCDNVFIKFHEQSCRGRTFERRSHNFTHSLASYVNIHKIETHIHLKSSSLTFVRPVKLFANILHSSPAFVFFARGDGKNFEVVVRRVVVPWALKTRRQKEALGG